MSFLAVPPGSIAQLTTALNGLAAQSAQASADALSAALLDNVPQVFTGRPGGNWSLLTDNSIETRLLGRTWAEDVPVPRFPTLIVVKGMLGDTPGNLLKASFSFQPFRAASGGAPITTFLPVTGQATFNLPGVEQEQTVPIVLPAGATTARGILRITFDSGTLTAALLNHRITGFLLRF